MCSALSMVKVHSVYFDGKDCLTHEQKHCGKHYDNSTRGSFCGGLSTALTVGINGAVAHGHADVGNPKVALHVIDLEIYCVFAGEHTGFLHQASCVSCDITTKLIYIT